MATALSFGEAREKLLVVVMANTMLVGHSLEGDLATLQLLHSRTMDTMLLFKVLQHHHSQVATGLLIKQFLKIKVFVMESYNLELS